MNTPLTGMKSVLSDPGCILYQNPVTNILTIVLPHQMVEVNSKINLSIYSLDGRKMRYQSYSPPFHLTKENVDIDGLKAGTYYLNLNDDRFV
jgi:hypothetical protein